MSDEAAIWILRTLLLEIDRFRAGSEDPSSESLSIDNLMSVIERTLESAEAVAS